MKYQVFWQPSAEVDLAQIWLDADSRPEIERAANRIDQQQSAPSECGESREAGYRVMLESPLGIKFKIFEAERRVYVANVWRYRVHQ